MALPLRSSPRCEAVAENESFESLVSKLPDALQVVEKTLCEEIRECSIEISAAPAVQLQDLPQLPDALEVNEEFVSDGYRECSIEISSSSGASAPDIPSGTAQPVEDGRAGLIEVECSSVKNMSSFSVQLPDLSDVSKSYRTTEEREKTRKFPVLLSENEPSDSVCNSNVISGLNSGGNVSDARENSSEVGDGVESCKDSGSESEGDDSKTASSSSALNLTSPKEKPHSVVKAQPFHAVLESKIAELQVASGPSKLEDEDSKSVRARKRQLKEVRMLLEGNDRCTEEKLRLLNIKYVQQVAETRQMEKDYQALTRKCKQINKEKETLCSELTKSTGLRQKLESLCRELQRQNKLFIDDNKRITSEEEQKRMELSAKFHETVKDISTKLEAQNEERLRQSEENELLHEKIKHFTQQFEIREQHFAHQLRTKSLEQQLLEVKLKQQQDLSTQAETKTRMCTEQIAQLLKTEQDLRAQLALYGDKFEQFQDTLTKSNEVFATFKTELEKMSKTVKKLEKEKAALKKKCEKSDVSIIELLQERDATKKQLTTTKNQKEKLEALCRSLQAERKQQSISFDSSNNFLPSQLENLKLSNPE